MSDQPQKGFIDLGAAPYCIAYMSAVATFRSETMALLAIVDERPKTVALHGLQDGFDPAFSASLMRAVITVHEAAITAQRMGVLHDAAHARFGDDHRDDEASKLLRSVFPEGEVQL